MTTKKHKNNKSYWVEDTPEKLSYICETLHDENMKLKGELTKYKMAFEILKYNLEITKTSNICNQPIIEVSCNMFVTPEQGELLEELMKGG